ncbi:MAG: four helix bundle protein [Nitrospira sp.]|nr:four helix bundle protein [Nitrospira sp.]
MRDFKKLKVWEKSHELTLAVYKATASFPGRELFGLTSQMRRSAASIPANIAEGCGRSGEPELARFLRISLGSASELEYHIILSTDLSYINKPTSHDLAKQVAEVKRMLTALIQKLTAES